MMPVWLGRDIGTHRHHIRPRGRQLTHDLGEFIGGACRQSHAGPGPKRLFRQTAPDPTRSAGNQDAPTAKVSRHCAYLLLPLVQPTPVTFLTLTNTKG